MCEDTWLISKKRACKEHIEVVFIIHQLYHSQTHYVTYVDSIHKTCRKVRNIMNTTKYNRI